MLREVLSVVSVEEPRQGHVMLRVVGCKAVGGGLLWPSAFGVRLGLLLSVSKGWWQPHESS